MSQYSQALALACGYGSVFAEEVLHAAPMHDIGKIGVPDAILLKPGTLDAEEWKIMHQHPLMGAKIIGKHDSELLETARIIALNHHEKWDGSGYPRGLKGTDIPLEGRIVAIADVFDALVSVRPYKPAFPLDTALQIVKHEEGRHFDPQLLQAFHQALPDILRIRDIYADENGALTDLELRLQEVHGHHLAPSTLTRPERDD
jgi:putative two-component system response regulator